MARHFYVSITGIRVRHFWQFPVFWLHAIRSMSQARRAKGLMAVDARTINAVHHTRSIWSDRDAMQACVSAGAHLKAMKVFRKIATGKTCGFEASEIPDWQEVHRLWIEKGRVVRSQKG